MSALAAAKDQEFDRLVGSGRGIANGAKGEDRGPDRISGMNRAGTVDRPEPFRVRKPGGNTPGKRRQQPVGAAKHGVLLVDQCRQAKRDCSKHGRQRRIAAKPDDRRWSKAAQQAAGFQGPGGQFGQAPSGAHQPAA